VPESTPPAVPSRSPRSSRIDVRHHGVVPSIRSGPRRRDGRPPTDGDRCPDPAGAGLDLSCAGSAYGTGPSSSSMRRG
jgi:hypothetical protein